MTQRNNPSAVSAYSGNTRCKLITPIMYIFFLLLFNPTVYLPVKYSPAFYLSSLIIWIVSLPLSLFLPDVTTYWHLSKSLWFWLFFHPHFLPSSARGEFFFSWQFCIQLLAATYLTITLTEAELLMFNKRTKLLIWILAPELFYF